MKSKRAFDLDQQRRKARIRRRLGLPNVKKATHGQARTSSQGR